MRVVVGGGIHAVGHEGEEVVVAVVVVAAAASVAGDVAVVAEAINRRSGLGAMGAGDEVDEVHSDEDVIWQILVWIPQVKVLAD